MKTAGKVASIGLKSLERAVHRDLQAIAYPDRKWVAPKSASSGQEILNVAIIGGGQSGLGVAFGLMLDHVDRVLVLDQSPRGQEGPWRTFARMPTLRTNKRIHGLDHELPSLTFQSWFEAQHGAAAWGKVGYIHKDDWAAYLDWYRETLQIPVRSNVRVGAIEWSEREQCFAIPLTPADRRGSPVETLFARKVVLATGIQGSGHWHTPEIVRHLDKRLYAHTHESIDFDSLKGKRIGVLGAGASAFDNACEALEAGASSVSLFFRRKEIPDRNPFQWVEFVGFLKHHVDLPDADKWRFITKMIEVGHQPPPDTLDRAARLPNFELYPQCPWLKVESVGSRARVHTPQGVFDFDSLILGTGFVVDLASRPELAAIAGEIALWKDRYAPPAAIQNAELGLFPYLGRNFEFQERVPGEAPYLSSIFSYTAACLPSIGMGGGTITGLKYSLGRVVEGITRQLYLEDREHHFGSLERYRDPALERAIGSLMMKKAKRGKGSGKKAA